MNTNASPETRRLLSLEDHQIAIDVTCERIRLALLEPGRLPCLAHEPGRNKDGRRFRRPSRPVPEDE